MPVYLYIDFVMRVFMNNSVWDYKKADSKNIWKALDSVNRERLFDQLDLNAQVAAFTETTLNTFRNYVPNK